MWETLRVHEVRKTLKTNLEYGLNEQEAKIRLNQYGENKLDEKKKESLILRFIKQFNDFMIIILIIASIISAIVAKLEGSNDYMDSIIIIAIVIFNAIMGLLQEAKAEKSIEALKKMTSPTAKVKRDGKLVQVESSKVVPGDIVILEAGCFVPADCRLFKSYNLKVEESSLTGETNAVLKDADVILKPNIPIGDMVNMVFATTIVTNGHAEAIVTETGMNTKLGKIAKMIITDEAPETPLQKKLGQVGKTLGIVCLAICVFIFIIGLIKKISPVEMFMTSVGLAVAAIPEGLPAIVTIMLSIGVTKMAKKNSIIRKLPAVETLGSSSVICSDKTGTLTQNKMQVVKLENASLNIFDEDKNLVLELATMCTDVEFDYKYKNYIGDATELAIVNAANSKGINKQELEEKMARCAEIPFDSERKMMTSIHKIGSKYRVITKGAPEVILKRCSRFQVENEIQSLNSNKLHIIEEKNNKMANDALRVLAVGYYDLDELPKQINSNNIEKNLIFARIDRNDRSTKRRRKKCSKSMQKGWNKNCNDNW